MKKIPSALLAWYDVHKRAMPWRDINNPYATWVSETMLQQTQVTTVVPYFKRFMDCFPTVSTLAHAELEEVLKLWEGLGYYSRARNLKKGAEQVVARHGGTIPSNETELLKIAGIGPYTAGAILSIAYNLPHAAVDGNVLRVLSRLYGVREDISQKPTIAFIRKLATDLVNNPRPGDFNQALMDLGATVCVPGTPRCDICPLSAFCDAFSHGDESDLPIKTQARPPKQMQVGVALVTCAKQILVVKRKERMLGGLYVFVLDEEGNTLEDMKNTLCLRHIPCEFSRDLGEAKHVFTHRVWNMRLYHFVAEAPVSVKDALWVPLEELDALPFPTAMRRAREAANLIYSNNTNEGTNL